jgi:hypothetical protein
MVKFALSLKIEGNLWILHNGLLSTFRIKRENVVGNIELPLFLDFVVCVQNLYNKKESRADEKECYTMVKESKKKKRETIEINQLLLTA